MELPMPRVRIALAFVFAAALLVAPVARSVSADMVVGQVYGGGGNSGATYTNDFVELFNRGSSTIDLSTWSVQYASASGTTWQVTPLSGSVQPGRYYLVQLASAAAIGAPLPTPDGTGTTNLANTGGKVALVRSATALSCGTSAGSCSADPLVADLVGYGSATDYEGSGPTTALSNTTAVLRAGDGCTDTDVNASDFSSATPAPRNSASPAVECAGGPPPSAGVEANAGVDIDIQSVLSIALERQNISFGNAFSGDNPQPVSEQVTISSNNAAGYALTVHRSAFQPADLPLGVTASAPSGGQVGPALAGGAKAPIPIAPAPDLLVGTTSGASASGGDVWPTHVSFTSPLPSVPPGRYTATITFTAIGR
jgi:Lamin Tail Domain